MKIFPSTHKIKSVTDSHVDLDLNIPLAYIELDYSKYKIDKAFEDIVNTDIRAEVLVNQEFSSPNIKLFNKFGEAVNMDNLLTRVGNKYYYRPKEMIAFEPQKFEYSVSGSFYISHFEHLFITSLQEILVKSRLCVILLGYG